MYIHELKDWPYFTWDHEAVSRILIKLHHKQSLLMSSMESIGFRLREETLLKTLTQDVVKSSEIEGEILDPSSVCSSVARHLGMDVAALTAFDRNIEGVVEMMLDATQKFDEPLTKERLFSWHKSLFPTTYSGYSKIQVGAWRTKPIQVISGRLGKETVHFEGPAASRVDDEMRLFLHWCNHNTTTEPILKVAIAHLWFLTIHPFDDGNGRIARAIADLMLACSEKSSQRFYSLSAQIQKERSQYYTILQETQKGTLEITSWLTWFFGCLERALEEALSTFNIIAHKAKVWDALTGFSLNERQKKIINLLLDGFTGKLTSSKWAKITKCSQDTAYRDILDLISQGILAKSLESGRSTSYFLIITPRLIF